jgi:hypothetical protein
MIVANGLDGVSHMAKSKVDSLNAKHWISHYKNALCQSYKAYLVEQHQDKCFMSAYGFVIAKVSDSDMKACGFKTRTEVAIYLSDEQPPDHWS